jgi:hypothetical protein
VPRVTHINSLLKVPISFLSASEADGLDYKTRGSAGVCVELGYDDDAYILHDERLTFFDLIEKLEEWSEDSKIRFISLRIAPDRVLSQSSLIDAFQRICIRSAYSNQSDSLTIHLAFVLI